MEVKHVKLDKRQGKKVIKIVKTVMWDIWKGYYSPQMPNVRLSINIHRLQLWFMDTYTFHCLVYLKKLCSGKLSTVKIVF
jgi:hypothetical protein